MGSGKALPSTSLSLSDRFPQAAGRPGRGRLIMTKPPDLFARYGLSHLLNASGTETVFGASPVSAEIIAAVAAILPHSVDMAELQAAASRVIARVTGAEAGFVTGCSSAGIVTAVAACMTGLDLGRIEQLPDTSGMRN